MPERIGEQESIDPIQLIMMGANSQFIGKTADEIHAILERRRLGNLDCSMEGRSPAEQRELELGAVTCGQVAHVQETE